MTTPKSVVARTAVVLSLACAVSFAAQDARAQWAVYDAANYSQNMVTAANAIKSVANEASMINNQVTQITNEINTYTQLVTTYTTMLQNWAQLPGTIRATIQSSLNTDINSITYAYSRLSPANQIAFLSSTGTTFQTQMESLLNASGYHIPEDNSGIQALLAQINASGPAATAVTDNAARDRAHYAVYEGDDEIARRANNDAIARAPEIKALAAQVSTLGNNNEAATLEIMASELSVALDQLEELDKLTYLNIQAQTTAPMARISDLTKLRSDELQRVYRASKISYTPLGITSWPAL
ncbi:MAG: hypothetical protein M0037_07995 [Betaproteobacteria bacterium]|nr:hypothetical protein [Betaproteobacteria bacterium]